MSFLEWLDTFKSDNGIHGLPISAYESADEEFEKDFLKKSRRI